MSHYIITGGQGFIGSRIVAATGGHSFDMQAGDDILDVGRLSRAFEGAVGVFHCAAKISVPESVAKPEMYHTVNVEGTKNVIETAEKYGLKIVFSSSAAVYAESDKPVNEEYTLAPKSPYGQNKVDAEALLSRSSVPHIALRYFNAYGAGQSPQYAGVITAFITNALKGNDLVIYGDGLQTRDFVFVEDIVEANIAAMNYKSAGFEVFNIASGETITIKELAELIIGLAGSQSKVVHRPARVGDIIRSEADISKAKSVLGWSPKCSLREGLEKTIGFYRGGV